MPLSAGEALSMVPRLTARDRLLARAIRGGTGVGDAGSMERALIEAAAALQSAWLPFALIGGLAVAVHTGLARVASDVNLAVTSDTDLDVLVRAFQRAGFTALGRHEHSLNFLHAGGDPVQLALGSGIDEAIARAEVIRVGSAAVRIVLRGDLPGPDEGW